MSELVARNCRKTSQRLSVDEKNCRKVVWELIASLAWSWLNAAAAIDRIYALYSLARHVCHQHHQPTEEERL
jgi:hypothetical protein